MKFNCVLELMGKFVNTPMYGTVIIVYASKKEDGNIRIECVGTVFNGESADAYVFTANKEFIENLEPSTAKQYVEELNLSIQKYNAENN